jgi:hypothetical protein
MKRRRTLAEAVYATLLRAYSSSFREAYRADAVSAFGDLHRDAGSRGAVAVLRLWVRTIPAVIAGGLRDRRDRRIENGASVRGSRGDFARDARLAVRTGARRPGFALTTIGLVALGIGATTTIFSVV